MSGAKNGSPEGLIGESLLKPVEQASFVMEGPLGAIHAAPDDGRKSVGSGTGGILDTNGCRRRPAATLICEIHARHADVIDHRSPHYARYDIIVLKTEEKINLLFCNVMVNRKKKKL